MIVTNEQLRYISKSPMIKPYVDFVKDLSAISKCTDKQVASIICNKDLHQVLSVGVNGGPKGLEHLECLCATESKYSCIHAEINALVKLHSYEHDKVMICSLAPCMQCASAIINEPGGFSAVLYLEPWKENMALNMLMESDIAVGYIDENSKVHWMDSFFNI